MTEGRYGLTSVIIISEVRRSHNTAGGGTGTRGPGGGSKRPPQGGTTPQGGKPPGGHNTAGGTSTQGGRSRPPTIRPSGSG